MPEPGRLDDLERKFEENPRRYFAPLANEYRKAGDTDRAIELCRTYLPDQPNHMSGYIVYGQALHDAGRGEEATAVFKQALTLDPENIIALRHLGDIARDAGDRRAATRWYGKVLELDPRNEEVGGLITSLATPGAASATRAPERVSPPQVRPEPEFDPMAVALEELVSQPDMPQPERPPNSWFDDVPPTPETAVAAGAASVVDESAQAGDPEADSPVDSITEIHIEQSFEGSETLERTPIGEGTSGPENATEPAIADESGAPEMFGAELAEEDDDIWGDAPATAAELDSPFVTETMAELYMQQGLTSEALIIYRRLAEKRDDPAIRGKIAELEKAAAQVARPDDSQDPAPDEVAAGAEAQAPPPLGETVRQFFARIGAQHARSRPRIAAENETGLSALFGSQSLEPSDLSAAQSLAGAFGAPQQSERAPD